MRVWSGFLVPARQDQHDPSILSVLAWHTETSDPNRIGK
jgi:hypothetical protein